MEQKKFYGSVIQRELALISNLFTVDNFPNITRYESESLKNMEIKDILYGNIKSLKIIK